MQLIAHIPEDARLIPVTLPSSGQEVIFVCYLTERIVSIVPYRDKLIIATSERIMQYDGEIFQAIAMMP